MTDVEVIEAYKQRNLEFFQQIIKNGMFKCILYNACVSENLDLLKFLVQHFQVDLNDILSTACVSGHMDIVQFAIDEGATHFNSGLLSACRRGHVEIVKLMIQKGANNFNDGLFCSTLYGNVVISKLMIDNGATNLTDGISNACIRGMLELIEIIFEKDVNYTVSDLNVYLQHASRNGHFDIVELFIRKGATDYKTALRFACLNLNYLYELEIENIICKDEEEKKFVRMIKLVIEYGANVKSCKELTRQIIVKTLNIGCNLNYFLHDEKSSQIINSHNNLKQHLRTILSHDNNFDSSQFPTDMIDYCIMPYVNYNL